MSEIFGQHRQDLNEVRRLCLICHGLDLTSDKLFSDSTYNEKLSITRGIFQNLVSSSILSLAVSIRINLYQNNFKDIANVDLSHCAHYYSHSNMKQKEISIKDVCDKIIHANDFFKNAFPKELNLGEHKVWSQFNGVHRKENWTLNISVEHFVEAVLNYLDVIEDQA